jgi:16S rRNA G966 N2-methylase RsmD
MSYLLTKHSFISKFETKSTSKNFNDFMRVAQVRNGDRLRPLMEYKKTNNISTEDLELLFKNIQNKKEYLERFYDTSLKPTENILNTEKPLKNREFNNNVLVNYKNTIRNMFYREILRETKSGIPNVPSFLSVLEDIFLRDIIDYKILTPSALFYLKQGRLGSVFSSFYFRASIMNPYLTFSLNKSLLKGSRIFTPTLGWGSYCYGFMESGIEEYVGTDVIPSVCNKVENFSKINYPNVETQIFCLPSEELMDSSLFRKKYKEHFDVVFFSPPYYQLELYPGKNQSTHRYKDYEEWLDKYWRKTIILCNHVLAKKGKMCYILSGYGSKGVEVELLDDMNSIAKEYFKLKSTQPMYNKNVHVTSHRETGETIVLFTK